jgi:hypothetical protein
MDLREMLLGVRELNYHHRKGKDQPAQRHLREARRELKALVPHGWIVLVSGSGQSLPVVPWIAVLDPEVTTTAQEGSYVVYLYRRDLTRVYLSMNQGTTQHLRNAEKTHTSESHAKRAALEILSDESRTIYSHLSRQLVDHLAKDIDLAAPSHFLPQGYEMGNVAAIEYDTAHLPDEGTLRTDLDQMRALYDECVRIKKTYLENDPGRFLTSATARKVAPHLTPSKPIFRPKDSTDYVVHIKEQVQTKGRRHEALLEAFAHWVKGRGMAPANNVHPRDLTVEADGQHWLIEAKTVRSNAEHAVREAVGQLVSYRHFLYRAQGLPDPELVALFSESVGEAFTELLSTLGIESIWPHDNGWRGSAPNAATSLRGIALARP